MCKAKSYTWKVISNRLMCQALPHKACRAQGFPRSGSSQGEQFLHPHREGLLHSSASPAGAALLTSCQGIQPSAFWERQPKFVLCCASSSFGQQHRQRQQCCLQATCLASRRKHSTMFLLMRSRNLTALLLRRAELVTRTSLTMILQKRSSCFKFTESTCMLEIFATLKNLSLQP